MKIYRLIKSELFKIFAKSSIFIMTFVFIVVLGITAVNFNHTSTTTQHGSENVAVIYNNFNSFVVSSQQSRISSLKSYITDLEEDIYSKKHQDIIDQVGKIKIRDSIFLNSLHVPTSSNPESVKMALHSEISTLRSMLVDSIDTEPISILVTEETYIEFLNLIDVALSQINEHDTDYVAIRDALEELDYINKFEYKLHKIGIISVDQSKIIDSNAKLDILDNRLIVKENEIITFFNENPTSSTSESIKGINSIIKEYTSIVDQAVSIVETKLKLNILSNYSSSSVREFKGFDDFNRYELSEINVKNNYLFDNEDYSHNFANQLAFNAVSNDEVNGFDFAVYALEIFAFIIILYAIFIGSKMFAGEEADGSIKLLAIRPYTRTKIVISKILTTYFIIFIFLIIGAIASIISGGILFGMESNSILSVINSSSIFIANPSIMFLIFLLSLFIQISFYATLAIAISTVFKSNVGAVILSTFIYFASIILVFISGIDSLQYLPTNNVSLFKYFGGSYLREDDILSSLFNSQVQIGSGLFYSLSIVTISIMMFVGISVYVFNNRELK